MFLGGVACESGSREGAGKSSSAWMMLLMSGPPNIQKHAIPIKTARLAAVLLTSLAVELMIFKGRKGEGRRRGAEEGGKKVRSVLKKLGLSN